ncbi:hypothetical protein Bbelb_148920 [Branchiostoma belcheri]|nr:hypothetical protein Bbelb_148920 [Branchiostoma belcheri]
MTGLEPGTSWFRVEYSATTPQDPTRGFKCLIAFICLIASPAPSEGRVACRLWGSVQAPVVKEVRLPWMAWCPHMVICQQHRSERIPIGSKDHTGGREDQSYRNGIGMGERTEFLAETGYTGDVKKPEEQGRADKTTRKTSMASVVTNSPRRPMIALLTRPVAVLNQSTCSVRRQLDTFSDDTGTPFRQTLYNGEPTEQSFTTAFIEFRKHEARLHCIEASKRVAQYRGYEAQANHQGAGRPLPSVQKAALEYSPAAAAEVEFLLFGGKSVVGGKFVDIAEPLQADLSRQNKD